MELPLLHLLEYPLATVLALVMQMADAAIPAPDDNDKSQLIRLSYNTCNLETFTFQDRHMSESPEKYFKTLVSLVQDTALASR